MDFQEAAFLESMGMIHPLRMSNKLSFEKTANAETFVHFEMESRKTSWEIMKERESEEIERFSIILWGKHQLGGLVKKDFDKLVIVGPPWSSVVIGKWQVVSR